MVFIVFIEALFSGTKSSMLNVVLRLSAPPAMIMVTSIIANKIVFGFLRMIADNLSIIFLREIFFSLNSNIFFLSRIYRIDASKVIVTMKV